MAPACNPRDAPAAVAKNARLRRPTDATLVSRRIDLPCDVAGFPEPPPARVHLKFIPRTHGWTLLALTEPGLPIRIAKWLLPFGPTEVNIAPGLSPKVLRANFDVLPPAWKEMLGMVTVHYLDLTAEGSASIFVADSLEKVERFVRARRVTSTSVRERTSLPGPARVKLTARQLEVLALAVALGYYETPHKVNLRTLAKKLGLSVGATSELLRRGESLIITAYIDSLSASRWMDTGEPR